MTGKGYDRWFDKSFTLCIGSNGRVRIYFFIIFIYLYYTENCFFIFRLVSMLSIHGKCSIIMVYDQ